MKYAMSSMIASALVVGMIVPNAFAAVTASPFVDVSAGAAYSAAVTDLASRGIVDGVDATHFEPGASITRAQFAAIVVRTLGLHLDSTGQTFSDVPTNDWAYSFIETAANAGIVRGMGDGRFDPNGWVTGEQAAAMLVAAAGEQNAALGSSMDSTHGDSGSIDPWAAPYVAAAMKLGIMSSRDGGASLDLKMPLARGDAAIWDDTLLQRMIAGTGSGSAGVPSGGASAKATQAHILAPSGSVDLPSVSDSTILIAQAEDANGNAVAAAGIPIVFSATAVKGQDPATLSYTSLFPASSASAGGGTTASVPTVAIGTPTASTFTAYTDANGQVNLTFTGSSVSGDAWQVSVASVNSTPVATTPITINAAANPAETVHVLMRDSMVATTSNQNFLNNPSFAQAGDTVTVMAQVLDENGGIHMGGGTLQIVVPSGLTNVAGFDGTTLVPTNTPNVYDATLATGGAFPGEAAFTATAKAAGLQPVDAEYCSGSGDSVIGGTSMTVIAGPWAGAAFFTGSGQTVSANTPLTVQGNQPVALWLRPIDAQGNPVDQGNAPQYVALSDDGAGGAFRLSPNGAPVNTITIPAGYESIPVYYSNLVAGSYGLSAAQTTVAATVSNVTLQLATTQPTANGFDEGTVTLYDAEGNVVPYNGVLAITVNTATQGVWNPTSAVFNNGVATIQFSVGQGQQHNVSVSVQGVGSAAAVTSPTVQVTPAP